MTRRDKCLFGARGLVSLAIQEPRVGPCILFTAFSPWTATARGKPKRISSSTPTASFPFFFPAQRDPMPLNPSGTRPSCCAWSGRARWTVQDDPAKAFSGRDKPDVETDYLRLFPGRLAETRSRSPGISRVLPRGPCRTTNIDFDSPHRRHRKSIKKSTRRPGWCLNRAVCLQRKCA